MNLFTRLGNRWKREMTIYHKGVTAGRQLMAASVVIEIPDDIKGSESLTRVFISGLDAGVKHHKYLEKEEAKLAKKKIPSQA